MASIAHTNLAATDILHTREKESKRTEGGEGTQKS